MILSPFLSTYKKVKVIDYTLHIPSSYLNEFEEKMNQFLKWNEISGLSIDHYQNPLSKGNSMVELVLVKNDVPVLFLTFFLNYRHRLQAISLTPSLTNERLNNYLKKKYNQTSLFTPIKDTDRYKPIEEANKHRLIHLFKND